MREKMFREVCASGDAELISLLLETSDEELGALERLYTATDEVRASGESLEERRRAIDSLLAGNPSLQEDFRKLTESETLR